MPVKNVKDSNLKVVSDEDTEADQTPETSAPSEKATGKGKVIQAPDFHPYVGKMGKSKPVLNFEDKGVRASVQKYQAELLVKEADALARFVAGKELPQSTTAYILPHPSKTLLVIPITPTDRFGYRLTKERAKLLHKYIGAIESWVNTFTKA